ncbi:hypothetical protein D3C72_578670 [compost metagenome]
MAYYQEKPDGLVVHVRVQPRASRSQLDGVVGDRLRLRLTAPPVEGEANKACIEFLAGLFGVPKSHVTLVAGQKAREKSLLVQGDAVKLLAVLNEALA